MDGSKILLFGFRSGHLGYPIFLVELERISNRIWISDNKLRPSDDKFSCLTFSRESDYLSALFLKEERGKNIKEKPMIAYKISTSRSRNVKSELQFK